MSLSEKVWNDGEEGCHNMYYEEDVKEFVREVLQEMDHLNEKFEAIAMRCNVETMAGDALLGAAE